MRLFPHIPTEILLSIFKTTVKKDLKAVRLVCRLWSTLAIPQLFDRIYISPRPKDLKVFREWSDHDACREAVKVLIVDASTFSDPVPFPDFVALVSPTLQPTPECEHGGSFFDVKACRCNLRVMEILDELRAYRDDIYYESASWSFTDLIGIDQPWQSRELDRLLEEFKNYSVAQSHEKAPRNTWELLQLLSVNSSRFCNLRTIIFQDDYCALTSHPRGHPVMARGDSCEVGSPFALSWPSRWPHPDRNSYNDERHHRRGEWHIFALVIQALSPSKTRLRELFLNGTYGSGIPIQYFHGEFLKTTSMPMLYLMKHVFSSLESLRLNIYDLVDYDLPPGDHERREMLKELNACLVQIKNLNMLCLSFQGQPGSSNEKPRVKFEEVFFRRSCSKWPRLTHLEIYRMTVYKMDILRFLKLHSLKTLCIGRLELVDSNWAHMLASMRLHLPEIQDFPVSGTLHDREGWRDECVVRGDISPISLTSLREEPS